MAARGAAFDKYAAEQVALLKALGKDTKPLACILAAKTSDLGPNI